MIPERFGVFLLGREWRERLYKNLVYNLVKRNPSDGGYAEKESSRVEAYFVTTMLNNDAELGAVKELRLTVLQLM